MMTNPNMKRLFLIFLALCFWSSACVPADSADDGGVGTTVNKPKPPSLSAFPDFDTALPDESLGSSASSAALSATRTLNQELPPMDGEILPDTSADLDVAVLWEGVFVSGGVHEAKTLRAQLEAFGTILAQTIADAGIAEIGDETQTVTLPAGTTLIDTSTAWSVEMFREPTDENFIRFYFRHGDTGLLQASYVLKTDDDAAPIKGLFAYVNPATLSTDATEGKRLAAFAFDFSDSAKNLFVIREEYGNIHQGVFDTFQLLEQCNASNKDCLGEYLELSDGETRQINGGNDVRFSWNDSDFSVCLADMSYDTGSAEVNATYAFTGPDAPSDDEITIDSCSVTTPHWGNHIFTADDLTMRYDDTDPEGGTALSYYGDGTSTSGWDTLTPELIDGWLNATSF